jgi:SAM-dependent methyltransferase
MLSELWDEIGARMRSHGYMKGVERTAERVRCNGEIFTPTDLVIEMIREIPLDDLGPGRTVLDPACGDGQFLVAAKWVKIVHHGMREADALMDIYGIDIMRDNVELCRLRLGGGMIVVGDALQPMRRLPEQSEEDRRAMLALFGDSTEPQTLFDFADEELAVS